MGGRRGETSLINTKTGGKTDEMGKEVEWKKVVDILKYMKRGKAPGTDGINNEMMVYGGCLNGSGIGGFTSEE